MGSGRLNARRKAQIRECLVYFVTLILLAVCWVVGSMDEPPKTPTLTVGSSGDDVLEVQEKLILLGYLSGQADGLFGENTAQAVELFQTQNDLNPTGECDKKTLISIRLSNKHAEADEMPAGEKREGVRYIGNRKTRRFHESGCASVDDMKEENTVELGSWEEAIEKGFVPCKRCKP